MIEWLLALPLIPLILAAALYTRLERAATTLAPLSGLPAATLVFTSDLSAAVPGLLLGTVLTIDGTTRVLSLLVALLWTPAGIFALRHHRDDPNARRFWLFWLLTLAGTLVAILAGDPATFYAGFAGMSFAAYGLIVHDGREESRRAGRIYLVLAITGEALLLTATLLIVARLGNSPFPWIARHFTDLPEKRGIAICLALGFGVKMGAVPLHVWLPLAHPRAPTAASAILSGGIVKLGLLGWLRWLPFGEASLPGLSAGFVGVGLTTAFYAVIVGIPQTRAKTILAYSTVSQMGLVTALVGFGLGAPERARAAIIALAVFVLHHGVAKSALFLGAGVAGHWSMRSPRDRWLFYGLLSIPVLAISGFPATGGALAKVLLKSVAGPTAHWLAPVLGVSSLSTTLLLARYLWVVRAGGSSGRVPAGLWAPWMALTGVTLIAGPTLLAVPPLLGLGSAIDASRLWVTPWPLAAGVFVAALATRYGRMPTVPEGDLVVAGESLVIKLAAATRLRPRSARRFPPTGIDNFADRMLGRAETVLRAFSIAGVLLFALILAMWVLAIRG